MKNFLYLFLVGFGLLGSMNSCGPHAIEISSKDCWTGKLMPGAQVVGSAYLVYFPHQKTIIRNNGCRGEIIGVAAGSDPAFFKRYDEEVSRKKDALGVEMKIRLDGHLTEDKLIFIDKIAENGNAEYFFLR
jgi:hypothetical protein